MRRRHYSFDHTDSVKLVSKKSVNQHQPRVGKPRKRKWGKIVGIGLAVVLVGIIGYVGVSAFSSAGKVFTQDGGIKALFNQSPLKQTDGITNILLLGKGGANHPGGRLTDTMLLVRIRQSDKKVATISIPRDLSVSIPGHGEAKINEVYADGFESTKDTKKQVQAGTDLLSQVIQKVAGVPVHYVVAADFDGFKDIVDTLGGVDVNVKNSFSDYSYPVSECNDVTGVGCAVKTASFTAGMQHMDGARALIYSRSRHSLDNGEGSDFARSARQQNLILAMKDKALSLGILANPVKVTELFSTIGDHLKTNMSMSEVKAFADAAKSINKDEITNIVLDNSATGLLESTSNGGYYLVPKAGNFNAIQSMVKNVFDTATSTPESINVEVYNGSGQTGLGGKVADLLKGKGIDVSKIANNPKTVAASQIQNGSGDSQALSQIKSILGSPTVITLSESGKIIVIIGKDYGK